MCAASALLQAQSYNHSDTWMASELGIPLAGTSWRDKKSQECDDCGGPMDYTLTFEADGSFSCVGNASDLEGNKWVGRWTVHAGEIILTLSHCFRTDNVHDEDSWSTCPQSVLTIFPGAVKRSLSTRTPSLLSPILRLLSPRGSGGRGCTQLPKEPKEPAVDCIFAFESRAAFESSWVRLEQNA